MHIWITYIDEKKNTNQEYFVTLSGALGWLKDAINNGVKITMIDCPEMEDAKKAKKDMYIGGYTE